MGLGCGNAAPEDRNVGFAARFAAWAATAVLGVVISGGQWLPAAGPADGAWRFAVSGDSRNCGDVVMPAIAASAIEKKVEFYWHLGDLRKIYDFDEDIQHEPEHLRRPMTIIDYENTAWDDFISNQIDAFGPLPFYLGIGNHEMIPPKTRDQFLTQFADWLDAPELRQQRLRDNPQDHRLRTYYHWVKGGVDFINLDNATPDQFDSAQLQWLKKVLEADRAEASVSTVVVGMHEALPESLVKGHSMNASAQGEASGRQVYKELLDLRDQGHKRVYLLASHSHLFMDGAFNTDYWRKNGGVLPGWIVGTAGAVRYPLPAESNQAHAARTNVYGYLLGTVNPPGAPEGQIDFEFVEIKSGDIPAPVVNRFTPDFVKWCFDKNSEAQ